MFGTFPKPQEARMAVDPTKPADAARPANDTPPEAAAESAVAESSTAESSTAEPATAEPARAAKARRGAAVRPELDETKRKFREALERKRGTHAAANAEGAQDTGKVHGSHGPAASRRSFRRKSGS
jgi:hypothetical protein